MSVTPVQIADKRRYFDQIEKLVHSHTLRKAESLCKLLRYLAEHELAQPGTTLKEYQIATEVFGRPEDFDPQADSAVRVQAGRLRLKLLDYYNHEGLNDDIIVEVPYGAYAVNFREREVAVPGPVPLPAPQREVAPPGDTSQAQRKTTRSIVAVAALSSLLAVAAAAIVILLLGGKSLRPKINEAAVPAALRTFWAPFVASPDAPWVIFSNAAFVGRPETGMRYLDPGRDSHPLILDHYTGVGEVLAVHDLDEVFNRLNHTIRVKRGSLFSLDDATDNDLIFVGSPAENLTLLDLPGTKQFVFTRTISGRHKGELGIRNVHPAPGEPAVFYPTNSSQPLEEDYSLVALIPGLNPARHVLILAGSTTIGTQAAVEFVCEKNSLEELMRRLAPHDGAIKPFEALLRVKVTRGVPMGSQLVVVRPQE